MLVTIVANLFQLITTKTSLLNSLFNMSRRALNNDRIKEEIKKFAYKRVNTTFNVLIGFIFKEDKAYFFKTWSN